MTTAVSQKKKSCVQTEKKKKTQPNTKNTVKYLS